MESNIEADSNAVLRVVVDSGSIRGFELAERCNLPMERLVAATSHLVRRGHITASGVINTDTVERVRFAPLCSGFQNAPA